MTTITERFHQFLTEAWKAKQDGLCVLCRRPAIDHIRTDMGQREYDLSGCCEECFDGLFPEQP